MKRAYVNIPRDWLNNYQIMTMPDKQFREFVTDYVHNPANIHYETDKKPERIAWERVRNERSRLVFKRDEHCCSSCGSTEYLEIDHIIPLARGGSNELDNLQILCRSCNRRKWIN